MMRILTPKGVLQEAVRAFPVCEMRNKLNKKTFRTVEAARGMDAAPTAIQIEAGSGMISSFQTAGVQQLLIGNLKTEAVRDILHKLLTQGYFDFSSLEYQKEMSLEDTVFDAGLSKPYATDYTYGAGCVQHAPDFGGLFQNDISANNCFGLQDNNTESWEEDRESRESGGSDDEE